MGWLKHFCCSCILIIHPQRKEILIWLPQASPPVLSCSDQNGTRISGLERSEGGTGQGLRKSWERDQEKASHSDTFVWPIPSSLACNVTNLANAVGGRHCTQNLKYVFLISYLRAHLHFIGAQNLNDLPKMTMLISGSIETCVFLAPKPCS